MRGRPRRGAWPVCGSEPGFAADPLVTAAAGATATTRVGIGIAMVNVWRMLPAALASAVRSLADVAPDRLTVTMGPWWEPAATQAGAIRHHPVAAMVEGTQLVRDLLAGETVSSDGPMFVLDRVSLERDPVDVPLLWGVMGPRMVAAAGAHADGVTLNYGATTDRAHDIITAARAAAEQAGRDPDLLRFPAHVLTCVDDDGDAALEGFRATFESMPLLRAEAGVPDGPVSAQTAAGLSACGTPAQVRDRIEAYLAAGATEVIVCSPLTETVTALDAALGMG